MPVPSTVGSRKAGARDPGFALRGINADSGKSGRLTFDVARRASRHTLKRELSSNGVCVSICEGKVARIQRVFVRRNALGTSRGALCQILTVSQQNYESCPACHRETTPLWDRLTV